MAGFDDSDDYDGLGLAELVRGGRVSSRDLVEECISRIERVNPEINGVVRPLYDLARARSREALGEG